MAPPKLTAEQVKQLLAMHKAGTQQGRIASTFGISRMHLWRIVNGKSCWNHLMEEDYDGESPQQV